MGDHAPNVLGADAFRMKGLHFYDNDGEQIGLFDAENNIVKIIDGRDKSADLRLRQPVPIKHDDVKYMLKNSDAREIIVNRYNLDKIKKGGLTAEEKEVCDRVMLDLESDEEAKDELKPENIKLDQTCAICVEDIKYGD